MSDRPRIHIPRSRILSGRTELLKKEKHYLKDVLRLREDSEVIVFDGEGREYFGKISFEAGGRKMLLLLTDEKVIVDEAPFLPKSVNGKRLMITVCQALTKNSNFDLVVRKCAELGASSLIPVITERTVKTGRSGVDRWLRISIEASRQCRRADNMFVAPVSQFGEVVDSAEPDLKLLAYEGHPAESLKKALEGNTGAKSIVFAVGPEGGFTPREVDHAVSRGFIPVNLGPRILRSETAPLVLLSVLQYSLGDMG